MWKTFLITVFLCFISNTNRFASKRIYENYKITFWFIALLMTVTSSKTVTILEPAFFIFILLKAYGRRLNWRESANLKTITTKHGRRRSNVSRPTTKDWKLGTHYRCFVFVLLENTRYVYISNLFPLDVSVCFRRPTNVLTTIMFSKNLIYLNYLSTAVCRRRGDCVRNRQKLKKSLSCSLKTNMFSDILTITTTILNITSNRMTRNR